MSGHTPGPWDNGVYHAVWNGGRRYSHIRSHGNLVPVATVSLGVEGYGHEEGEANARLIAAAPDLIDALVMALPYVEVCEADPAYKAQHVKNVVKQIRAALAKASPQDNGE